MHRHVVAWPCVQNKRLAIWLTNNNKLIHGAPETPVSQFDSTRFDSIRFDSIRCDSIRYDSIEFHSISYCWCHMAAATSHKEPRQVSTFFGYVPDPPAAGTRQQCRQAIGQSNEIYQYGNGKLKRKEKTIRNENVEGAESNRKDSRWRLRCGRRLENVKLLMIYWKNLQRQQVGKTNYTAWGGGKLWKVTVSVSVQTEEGSGREREKEVWLQSWVMPVCLIVSPLGSSFNCIICLTCNFV